MDKQNEALIIHKKECRAEMCLKAVHQVKGTQHKDNSTLKCPDRKVHAVRKYIRVVKEGREGEKSNSVYPCLGKQEN